MIQLMVSTCKSNMSGKVVLIKYMVAHKRNLEENGNIELFLTVSVNWQNELLRIPIRSKVSSIGLKNRVEESPRTAK